MCGRTLGAPNCATVASASRVFGPGVEAPTRANQQNPSSSGAFTQNFKPGRWRDALSLSTLLYRAHLR